MRKLFFSLLIISSSLLADNNKADISKETFETYVKWCQEGNMWGCVCLGNYYEAGNIVSKDIKKANELYKKACDEKNIYGCEALNKLKTGK